MGKVSWAQMEDAYDVVSIGFGSDRRIYPVRTGHERWKEALREQFPREHEAIDRFFELLKENRNSSKIHVLLKLVPLWLARILCKTGLVHLMTNQWTGKFNQSCLDLCRSLTSDKDLQTVFTYCFGDYGTPPSQSNFFIQALLLNHYSEGASYPVGGASEIALNVIPVIERSGGKVLVRAPVQEILHNGKKAMGVAVKKGGTIYRLEAPVIVSATGVNNTFGRLLSPEVAQGSYYTRLAKELKPSIPLISVFVGLNASNEELGLKAENIWAFASNDAEADFNDYMEKSANDVMDTDLPLLFVSFPSAKDPNWSRHPGRASRSTCAIISLAKWEWYERFKDTDTKRRGDDYEELKKAVGDRMIRQAVKLFPQLERHIDYVEV